MKTNQACCRKVKAQRELTLGPKMEKKEQQRRNNQKPFKNTLKDEMRTDKR